jgi:AAHS family 4-hydroxybenzoate transporter-like MFS transporter
LCVLVSLVEGIDLNLIPLLAGDIRQDWNVSPSEFGVILSSGPVGLIIGGLGIGWLADRIGRRNALIAAMAMMTLPTIATAYVANVPELLACRLLTGVGFGGVVPASAAMVSEFLPTRLRANLLAFVILFQSAGGLVASLAMQTAIGTMGWQTIVLWMGAICAAGTLLLLAALPESPRYLLLRHPGTPKLAEMLARLRLTEIPAPEADQQGTGRGSLTALFTHNRALGTLLLWAVFIGVCAVVSFCTTMMALLLTSAGWSTAEAARVASFYWGGGILSGIALPLFALRWHVNRVLLGTILMAVTCTAGVGLTMAGALGVNLGVAFACGMFVNGSFYLLYPPAVRFYPTEIRSTGVGAAVAFGRFGNVLSPLAGTALLEIGVNPGMVFVVMATPMLLSVAALAVFHARSGEAAAE